MRKVQRLGVASLALLAVVGGFAIGRKVQADRRPSASMLFNGWGLSPVGQPLAIGDMPLKLVASPDRKQIVTCSLGFKGAHLTTIDVETNRTIDDLELGNVWNGLAFSPDGKTLYASAGPKGLLVFDYSDRHVKRKRSVPAPENSFISGIAVHPQTGVIYALNESFNQLYVLDPTDFKLQAAVNTGDNPHSCRFGEDGRHLYISNWGGKSVTVIDTKTNGHVRDIRVGVRPNDMALAPDGRLFVACAGDNSVHVIQTRSVEGAVGGPTRATRPPEGVREILSTSIEPTLLEGSSPVGISVSPDGKRLFVANADNNDVMVADISDANRSVVRGFIPTGWYPTSVLSLEGGLFIAQGKGQASRANFPAKTKEPEEPRPGLKYDYTGNCLEGYVSKVGDFDAKQLAAWTLQVAKNTPFHVANVLKAVRRSDSAVPDTVGAKSPVDHVLYVVMENRTYDQVFGDVKEGWGDPSLCMFGEKITPNRHKLAREYTLLDNFYCNGEVSFDGHSWCDAAIATDEMQRQWTSGYSDHGSITNGDELQVPTAGYIWDAARRHGLSVRTYGEGDSEYLGGHATPVECRGTWKGGRDMDRVDGWIADLHAAEKSGSLANLMVMSLGEDHTSGTKPGAFTPEACVGSNDVAIGKIVEAASRSKFWNSMAIFFVEDDAQDGPDHIDAHRTFALVVGPHVKRGFVDHTMYSQVSMLRTIELLLGLPPMTQFDAAATPMFNAFSRRESIWPYVPIKPSVDLFAKNTKQSPGAALSSTMDFREYDKAPAMELNRVLWAAMKGPNEPYPPVRRGF